ncbi:hypothetical protein [Rossellomorea aquimaris]|uniref:Uncharacterized protein n=1 Tax=Rossellomorea aquimaris TaxID=189382 RepID=A0A5D4U0L3_9BACI|nr:hypothetical protein [Rossellomorea aquimaris]TYS80834.1 hypothetical protein FZC80_06935 [Rossellomorea aquimaris]
MSALVTNWVSRTSTEAASAGQTRTKVSAPRSAPTGKSVSPLILFGLFDPEELGAEAERGKHSYK